MIDASRSDLSFDRQERHKVNASVPAAYSLGRSTPMRNCWFAIAHVSKVQNKPVQRMLFGAPIVLWRTAKGQLVAMEDRCAHRRTPLSAGKVIGDGIQCAYHGWTYDACGSCVRIPSLGPGSAQPNGISVPTYPIVQRYGYVWLWWGDAAAANVAYIPDVPFIHPDRPRAYESTYIYDCSSDLLVENVLDLTHLDFVHSWLLGDPYGGYEDITVAHTDETLTMQRRSNNRRPPMAMSALMGFPGSQDVVMTTRVHLRSNCVVAAIWYKPPGWGLAVVLPCVPETESRTRNDFSLVVTGAAHYRALITWTNKLIGAQDNGILRVQHPAYHAWSHMSDGKTDRSVAADKGGINYRQLRSALFERQARGDYGYGDRWEGEPAEQALEVSRVT